jgi:2-polyprenyl-6-methoxyphenol hydroxylase-like FAD-dependent oxidoreductase
MVWGRRHCEQMKSDMQDVKVGNQILIVGAGPSRLALAAEPSRSGLSTAIIDRQETGANTSRACVVHARTMEVLESLGVTRDLLAEGV